jgi:hypothetical protein
MDFVAAIQNRVLGHFLFIGSAINRVLRVFLRLQFMKRDFGIHQSSSPVFPHDGKAMRSSDNDKHSFPNGI